MKKQFSFFTNPVGFSLIELLIVIMIIGILTSAVIIAINPVEIIKRSRDTKRLDDMQNLVKGLQLYVQQFEVFPGTTASYGESESVAACGVNCGGWDTSGVNCDPATDSNPFIEPLVDQGFFINIPVDPINTTTASCGGFHYRYYLYAAGSYGCDVARGDFYILGVNDMETSGRPHSQSLGFSCPTRNWQAEFDWVTGQFTK